MKKVTNKIDYSLVEDSLNNQLKQILVGIGSVPEIKTNNYKQIIIVGMGGSRLPAEILYSALAERLLLPITIVSDYSIPKGMLTKETAVIAVSYSGNTEEVLSVAKVVSDGLTDLYTISAGGELATIKARANIVFSTENNSSGQPRYGTGYMVGVLLGLLQSIGGLNVNLKEIKDSLAEAEKLAKPFKKNIAKISDNLKNKIPVFVAAEHLSGLLPLMQNQIHETAKNFACHFCLPNLNHHLLEGLANPKLTVNKLCFVLFDSVLYGQRNVLRMKLTAQIIKKQGLGLQIVKTTGSNKLTQVFMLLATCGEISLQLAKNNKVDPAIVPWVDYFKKQLSV